MSNMPEQLLFEALLKAILAMLAFDVSSELCYKSTNKEVITNKNK